MSQHSYSSYKDSGTSWEKKIPSQWTVSAVKRFADFTTGWTPPSGNSEYYGDDYYWVNISDMGPQVLSQTAKGISQLAIDTFNVESSNPGDLMFSFKLSIGQVSLVGAKMFTNEAIATFRKSKTYDINWAFYAFPEFLPKNAEENIYGAPLLNQERIKNAKVFLPPLEEQTLIATYLNQETRKIDDLIGKKEKLIELLLEKRKSIISNTLAKGLNKSVKMKDTGVDWLGSVPVHWAVKKFKYCANLVQEKTSDKSNVIALENIQSWTGRLIESESIFEGGGIAFKEKDVLFGKLRPYLAKVNMAINNGQAFGDILVFRAKKELRPEFLFYLILNAEFIKLVNSSTYGTKMPRASWDFIGSIEIPIPSIDEQEQMIKFINSETSRIDTLIEKSNVSIRLLREHRASLISATVTGKIDVRKLA